MKSKTKRKKMNIPFGLLSQIAKRADTTPQSVGATLGIYESTNIGVSDEKQAHIKAIAKEVAMEKVIEYGEFLDTLQNN